jgi:hypothetical protein
MGIISIEFIAKLKTTPVYLPSSTNAQQSSQHPKRPTCPATVQFS